MQRPVSIALVVLLGLVGSLAVLLRGGHQPLPDDQRSSAITIVRGVVDPSSARYFADSRVRREFAAHGLRVEVASRKSADLVRSRDLNAFDFVLPSTLPMAEKIQKETGAATSFSPFYSPLVIATTPDVAIALAQAGVAD